MEIGRTNVPLARILLIEQEILRIKLLSQWLHDLY